MSILDKYLKEIGSKSLANNYAIRPSPIHGNGVFATQPMIKGQFINTHFEPGTKITDFGRNLNHCKHCNAKSKKQRDGSYHTYATKNIAVGDEVTLDYTVNKDLEQPQPGWKDSQVSERTLVKEPPPKQDKDEIDVEVDGSDDKNMSYESSDTVYGQGTAPNPNDETYLGLLKKSTKAKVKVTIDKDGRTSNPDLHPSQIGGPPPK